MFFRRQIAILPFEILVQKSSLKSKYIKTMAADGNDLSGEIVFQKVDCKNNDVYLSLILFQLFLNASFFSLISVV